MSRKSLNQKIREYPENKRRELMDRQEREHLMRSPEYQPTQQMANEGR